MTGILKGGRYLKKELFLILAAGAMIFTQASAAWGAGSGTSQEKMSQEEIQELPGWKSFSDEKTVLQVGEICDYPSLRDGITLKEVESGETLQRIGTLYDGWSCVIYTEDGQEVTGYILTDLLEQPAEDETASGTEEDLSNEGMIGQSTDIGVFAEASQAEAIAALEGEVVTAAEGTTLNSLGTYRITHYCPCSICCGPWAGGPTSTGVTAMTNRTIAVDPTVIPYGCNVVINGQVYVAEDCGGAIKGNRIDVYVASHQEAMEKGVFYTEVYLVE